MHCLVHYCPSASLFLLHPPQTPSTAQLADTCHLRPCSCPDSTFLFSSEKLRLRLIYVLSL